MILDPADVERQLIEQLGKEEIGCDVITSDPVPVEAHGYDGNTKLSFDEQYYRTEGQGLRARALYDYQKSKFQLFVIAIWNRIQ